jgi:UTP--glucose-1-phosphate uridylyltransferase
MYGAQQLSKAVIPVGGLGTRMLPATKVLPKELLPVGRRPMVQYVVEEMRAAGLENVCFVTGRKKTLIQEHFDHDPELVRHLQDRGRDDLLAELAYLESGLHLQYIRQSGPQGLADALTLVEDFVGQQSFVMALGDSIICESEMGTLLRSMIQAHVELDAAATLAVEAVPADKVRNYSVIVPAQTAGTDAAVFDIIDVIDKPRGADAPSHWAVAARYVFSPAIFPAIRHTRPGRGGEVQLMDAVRTLIRSGSRVQVMRLSPQQRRHDIGNFGGYFRAFLEFALMDTTYGEELRDSLQQVLARKNSGEHDGCE